MKLSGGEEGNDGAEPLVGIEVVWDRHRADEVLLKARLDRRLDLLDAANDVFDLAPCGDVQERDAGAGARRVPGRGDPLRVAIGDSPRTSA